MEAERQEMRVERHADLNTIIVTSLLLLYGLVMVYSASAPFSLRHYGNDVHLFVKQLIAAGAGGLLMWGLSRFDYHRLAQLDDILLVGGFLLTLLTLFPRVGDGRWLDLGPFALQPTEFLKFALIVYLAATIVRKGERIKSYTEGVLPFVIVLAVIAAVVINQPDLGMILVLASLTAAMLFFGGAQVRHLLFTAVSGVPFVYLAILIAPYRLSRIIAFIDPHAYASSSGYQIIQSLTAIGAGGIFGRGLGASQAKLFYLPQAHNDFIFSVLAEELGLIGALVLIGLFVAFAWRAFVIAGRAPDRLGRLLALGIGFTISLQAILNLGVALAILPVTGLTLPFVSNGGSSLLVTLGMVGVLLNVSRQGGES
ncbi:putative lipid II flippase FtsW [Candidatus Bipolaricaulota bacterium]|nr:putative lipid II flippase FtsW [Candidatus Bipolaricaulota bacterium]